MDERFSKEGITFDDVLLMPSRSKILPGYKYPNKLNSYNQAEYPHYECGDGHRYRIPYAIAIAEKEAWALSTVICP